MRDGHGSNIVPAVSLAKRQKPQEEHQARQS